MKEQLEKRLQQLKAEYESGQKVLAELETKQANVKQTLLRIAGAIQVLEEELANVEQENNFVDPKVASEIVNTDQ
ncbi:MAG: hypothetical protein F6K50_50350 [Moorea sp. SIO3I7]|uniref:Uncharacterized protein n=1 Tax=Moorena bouillonii PNG TaxID=568701 RepID=A0A1U7MYH8_9CYAN|nr:MULTISPECIES: hypothetical protein [Moorena]NEO03230.1 hypothetical protein [Moorena sp. SIO3I7]NEO50827.1 hypothetical protein [Moorena sp. SIO4A3]NEO14212.1 hypothetical protein [Moorena sp. SIO3E8]NEP29939.1 hypothetical protein [Moorena sp. SIO3I6]NEQ00977.1 hypothetical protein [Moorena sp. SIO3F7]